MIECLGTSNTFDGAQNLMYDLAKNFVLQQNGKDRADNAFKYSFKELQDTDVPDGIHLESGENCIIVYKKKTEFQKGYLYNTALVNVELLERYAITECEFSGHVAETRLSQKPREKEHGDHVSYISELKTFLKTFKPIDVDLLEEKIVRSRSV